MYGRSFHGWGWRRPHWHHRPFWRHGCGCGCLPLLMLPLMMGVLLMALRIIRIY